jgi:peptidoglycan hydrolase-like protein with peptidoglycan-binding domain
MIVKPKTGSRMAGLMLLAASLSFAGSSPNAPQPAQVAASAQQRQPVHHPTRKSRTLRLRGQKAIDQNRVRQIQEALTREHYFKGEPSGKWDSATQQAMHRYQADQGWQSKTVPDSRALIRLGLGPDQEHLLNPESAMTTQPSARASSATTAKSSPSQASASPARLIPAGSVEFSAPALSSDPAR